MDRRYKKKMEAYWARAEARAKRELEQLDFSSWFDYWHTHPDWYGRGNSHAENRADVAAMTVRVLHHLEQLVRERKEPIQLWATLRENTADNAVYAHSPNPNGTPYPYGFEGVRWGSAVPGWVAAAVCDAAYDIGIANDESGAVYYLVARRP